MEIEITPSNRSRCKECHNIIQKGSKRLADDTNANFGYIEYKYYCKECAIPILKAMIGRNQMLLKELTK